MNYQKGFVSLPILIMIVLGLVVVGGGGYYAVHTNNSATMQSPENEAPATSVSTATQGTGSQNTVTQVTTPKATIDKMSLTQTIEAYPPCIPQEGKECEMGGPFGTVHLSGTAANIDSVSVAFVRSDNRDMAYAEYVKLAGTGNIYINTHVSVKNEKWSSAYVGVSEGNDGLFRAIVIDRATKKILATETVKVSIVNPPIGAATATLDLKAEAGLNPILSGTVDPTNPVLSGKVTGTNSICVLVGLVYTKAPPAECDVTKMPGYVWGASSPGFVTVSGGAWTAVLRAKSGDSVLSECGVYTVAVYDNSGPKSRLLTTEVFVVKNAGQACGGH
jgi:hypothetical protein